MNLSMYAEYAVWLNYENNADAFRHFYNKGVRYVDMNDDTMESLPLHLYCKQIREGGIIPGALVTILNIASFDKKEREMNIAVVKGYIDQMEKLDVPILMPAPTIGAAKNADEYKEMQNLLIEALTEVAEYAKGSGVKVVIENQSSLLRPDSKIDDLRYILEAVPELGFVLDSGNFFCIGEDVLKAYESLKDRMVRCHCKDWAFNPYGMYIRENMPRFEGVAIGDGVLPLDEMFKKFRDDNFDGGVVLEINARKLTLDMLERSIEFLREEMRV